MASEQLKAMFMKRMFEQQQARKAGKQFKGMMGTPSREIDVHRPDENSPFGLMNVETEKTQGTGLFNDQVPAGQRYNQLSDKMIQSGNPLLQKQGMDMLGQMQGDVMSGQGGSPTTFAMGAPDGQMQRAYLSDDGSVQKVGNAYDPRNPYLDVGTGYVNPYQQENEEIKKKLYEAEHEKKMAVSDTNFYTNYNSETRGADELLYDIEQTENVMNDMAGLTGYNTVGYGNWLSALPMTDAKDWVALRDTVRSKLALTKMMQLKQASATGSTGFGALNEKELKILVENLANLGGANTPKAIKRELERIYNHFDNVKRSTRNIMKDDAKKYDSLHRRYNNGAPAPEWQSSWRLDLPNGVSEEDVSQTMADTGLGRDEVIRRVNAKNKGQ